MGLLGEIKEIAELVQKVDNMELYRKILELQEQALREQEEKQQLQERIAELERQLDLSGRLRFSDDAYWLATEAGDEDGPFCSVCWDQHGRLLRLHRVEDRRGHCPGCRTGTYQNVEGWG